MVTLWGVVCAGGGEVVTRPVFVYPTIISWSATSKYLVKNSSSVHGANSPCTCSLVSSSIHVTISSNPTSSIASLGLTNVRPLFVLIFLILFLLSVITLIKRVD